MPSGVAQTQQEGEVVELEVELEVEIVVDACVNSCLREVRSSVELLNVNGGPWEGGGRPRPAAIRLPVRRMSLRGWRWPWGWGSEGAID